MVDFRPAVTSVIAAALQLLLWLLGGRGDESTLVREREATRVQWAADVRRYASLAEVHLSLSRGLAAATVVRILDTGEWHSSSEELRVP